MTAKLAIYIIFIEQYIYIYIFNPVFMLSTVTSFEKLPKHNEYGFISESFALNWY